MVRQVTQAVDGARSRVHVVGVSFGRLQDLQRHVAVKLRVAGSIHLALCRLRRSGR